VDALAAIRRLADAYAIAMDEGDGAALAGLFAPGGGLTVHLAGRSGPLAVFGAPDGWRLGMRHATRLWSQIEATSSQPLLLDRAAG
jgi:hypothetical protein